MVKPQELITDAELEVLKLLWANKSMTARELTEAIYGDTDNSAIGTVQKLLQRLEGKQCVRRDRRQHVHRFSASVTQQEIAARHLDSIADKVTDGSLAPFITHLVKSKRLSDEEKEVIRQLLDE